MKRAIFTLSSLLLALAAQAQDCDKFIKQDGDKMEGTSYVTSKETIIVSDDGGKTGFGIYLMQSGKNNIIFSIQAVGSGAGCIDEDSKIIVLFKDGTKVQLINSKDFNCKGQATVYFGGAFGRKKELGDLSNKMIATMRVYTHDSFVEMDFPEEQASTVVNTLRCLTNGVKL